MNRVTHQLDRFAIWIAHGQLHPAGERLRVRKQSPGSIVGEIAAYLGVPRTADVVAESEAVSSTSLLEGFDGGEVASQPLASHF